MVAALVGCGLLVSVVALCAKRSTTNTLRVEEARTSQPLISKFSLSSQQFMDQTPSTDFADAYQAIAIQPAATLTAEAPKLEFKRRVPPNVDSNESPSYTDPKSLALAASSAVFCRCGGPSRLVKLLPCGHTSLCLSCAQFERSCPVCGGSISDSLPSWRSAGR